MSTTNNIGILDPDGLNPNPFTQEPYTENYKKLAQSWSKLPAYKHIHEILKMINDNQVSLFAFGTGVGKTSIIPRATLHHFNYEKKIMISLPKQLISKSGALYASSMLDVPIGSHVGYKYKGSPKEAMSNQTKLLFASDGTVVGKLLKNPLLPEFECVIVDELHEHKIQIDMLLYLLRELLKKRPEFKIILMSATVDVNMFKNYFNEFKFDSMSLSTEKHFPITSIFSPRTLDYDGTLKECFNTLITILETDDPTITTKAHDIIIFVTSSSDGQKLCKQLYEHQEKEKNGNCKITCHGQTYCVEVYSGMDPKKETLAQDKDLYKQQGNYNRKVVIGTNVMESSLTINGIGFVIDTGYEFSSSFDPINSARKLDRELITVAQALQRAGRSGRTEPGTCYHLYSEHDYKNKMLKYPEPDIQTSDITMECMQLLGTPLIPNTQELLKVLSEFVAVPKEVYIKYSLNILLQMGIIENDVLTNLGKLLIGIPCNNLFLSVAIVYGKIYNCSRELLQIAMLIEVCKANVNELFNIPNARDFSKEGRDKTSKFEKVKNKLANKYGDCLTLLYILESYDLSKDKVKYCKDKFLKHSILEKAFSQYKNSKHQLQNISESILNDLGVKMYPEVLNMDLDDRVLFCLMVGLRLNVGTNKKGTDYYRVGMSNMDNIKINKSSFLNGGNKMWPNIVYYELFISMGRAELSMVNVIPDKIAKIIT